MHNLFQGTAKAIMKDIWIRLEYLNERSLAIIQGRVESIKTPVSIGGIPKKISSSFAEFTSDQWKNWVNTYSLYCLRDQLPLTHYRCWELFVLACRILSEPWLTKTDIQMADALLLSFCK